MAKQCDKQFKLDAVQYYHDHRNLGPLDERRICISNQYWKTSFYFALNLDIGSTGTSVYDERGILFI